MTYTSRFGNMQVEDEPTYLSQKGVPNGIAALDAAGLVPTSQLPPQQTGSGNQLISGGVTYSGVAYDYDVSALVYSILGVIYNSAATSVSLAASDPVLNRIDVIYADDQGIVGVITGTPAANPQKPNIDNLTQVEVTFISVQGGTTSPTITTTLIYNEDAGSPAEWVGTSDDLNVNFASTNNPYSGTVSIETLSPLGANKEIILTPAVAFPIEDGYLSFRMQAKVDMTANSGKLYIGWFGTTANLLGNAVQIAGQSGITYGFDASNTSSYQLVSIPLSAFGTLPQNVNELRFFKTGGVSTANFFLDLIQFQTIPTPLPVGDYFQDNLDVELDFDDTSGNIVDDGKIPFYDFSVGKFITSEQVTFGTSVIDTKFKTSPFVKGTVVSVAGFDNDIVEVDPATQTSEVLGISAEPHISSDAKHTITYGKITGLDTSNNVTTLNPNGETWAVSDELYRADTSGGLTNVLPALAGTIITIVATVLKVDATGGQLFINIHNLDGHVIEDEGTPLTQRSTINFTGAGVTVTDTGDKTTVNVTGGGGGSWTPPNMSLSNWLNNGTSSLANANAGFQKSFDAVSNDEMLSQIDLRNNGIDYDGSGLSFKIVWQLFGTAPSGGDNVIWELDAVLVANGEDGDSKAAFLISTTIDVSARTANQIYTDTLSASLAGVAGAKFLGLTLRRRSSGGGADSYPSAVDVFAFEII
jgi:hypothetical protein